MKKLVSLFTGISLVLCGFAQNFPFPMNEKGYKYPYGITPTTPNNENIQSKFEAWEKAMWEESGEFGRIKYDDKVFTVSEGIAYGMLIYVYMANETNTQCQDHFDKLYSYYKNWSNKNGLMNWKITGFSSVAEGGNGGATDADLDVGLALCLAAKQWGSSAKFNYSLEAEKILKSVFNYETETQTKDSKYYLWLKSGDTWNSVGNPCYFTVASLGVFEQAQESLGFYVKKDWSRVHTDSFEYLRMSEKNGVWPNWSDWEGNPSWRPWLKEESERWDEQQFGWDACRVPWRIAWDYIWFGTQDSKDLADSTIAMLDAKGWNKAPLKVGYLTGLDKEGYENIKIGYPYSAGNSAWTGSVACSFMTNSDRQDELDTYYEHVSNCIEKPYYAQTLQVLYLLTLSGNAANFYAIGETNEKSILQSVIEKANFIKEHAIIGNGNGEYLQSVVDVLSSAILDAQRKYDDKSLSVEEIAGTISDLNNAINTFNSSSNVVADKTELQKYIDLVTEILSTTTAGASLGQYSVALRQSLEKKLNQAKSQNDKIDASQAMVDRYATSLKETYEDYLNSKVTTITSIEDHVADVNIFPNPSSEVLNILAADEITYIYLVNVWGVKTLYEVGGNSTQINISNFASGIYSLQIVFANGEKAITKFIKK